MRSDRKQAEMSGFEYNTKNPKWDQAICALLTEKSQEAAAKKLKVGTSTLRRWLSESSFRKLFRESRTQFMEQSFSQLSFATSQAVATLVENLSDQNPAIQVRAAVAILDMAVKGSAVLDIDNRLTELEEKVFNQGMPRASKDGLQSS